MLPYLYAYWILTSLRMLEPGGGGHRGFKIEKWQTKTQQ
jgi:hypothetical protein